MAACPVMKLAFVAALCFASCNAVRMKLKEQAKAKATAVVTEHCSRSRVYNVGLERSAFFKGIFKWEDCQAKCNEREDCSYFTSWITGGCRLSPKTDNHKEIRQCTTTHCNNMMQVVSGTPKCMIEDRSKDSCPSEVNLDTKLDCKTFGDVAPEHCCDAIHACRDSNDEVLQQYEERLNMYFGQCGIERTDVVEDSKGGNFKVTDTSRICSTKCQSVEDLSSAINAELIPGCQPSEALTKMIALINALDEAWSTCAPEAEDCTSIKNFNDRSFSRCDFWGDPHWTASFFGKKFDFMGSGIFQIASTSSDSFSLQSFQCPWGRSRATVSVAIAMKIEGKVVFVSRDQLSIWGDAPSGSDKEDLGMTGSLSSRQGLNMMADNGCVRLKLEHAKGRHGSYHNLKLRVKTSLKADKGICGLPSPRENVAREDVLFSPEQIKQVCQMCRGNKPSICGRRREAPTEIQAVATSPEEACANANPPIPFEVAKQKCEALKDDQAFFEGCIFDYCASDGDESMVENAEHEKELDA